MPRVPRKSTAEHRDAKPEPTRKPRRRMASSPKPTVLARNHIEPSPCDTCVSVVTSSDYLTSVNFVAGYPTREYAACNEAIATEYPLLQGTWDFEEIDHAFKALNDSKLEELDPKYIQKQAKKATSLEARSSDLVYFQAYCNTAEFTSLTHSLTNYGIKIKYRWDEFRRYYQGLPLLSAHYSVLNQPSEIITPSAAEGEQFVAEARSSDKPMLVHTTCMAGYNLMFESLNHREDGWMRTALRRVHTMLHLPFVYPAGFDRVYAESLHLNEPSFKTLGFSMCIHSSSYFIGSFLQDMAGKNDWWVALDFIRKGLTSRLGLLAALDSYQEVDSYTPKWFDPDYSDMLAYSRSDVEKNPIAELEIRLQEAIAYGQRQKEKLDAMVMVYNRAMKERSAFNVTAAEHLAQLLVTYETRRKLRVAFSWGGQDILALAIVAQITGRPAFLYRAGFPKAELVETPKHCFCGPIRVGSLSVRHMGHTFNTPQEWRAYYEPIIARLDSPDASA